MPTECEYCGNALTPEEVEHPEPEGNICNSCYRDHFEFDCCRCGNPEHIDHQHVFCAVFEALTGLGGDVEPGVYELVRFPYYADGVIEGYVYHESFRRVRDLDFESTDDYPMGHLCRTCRKDLKLRQSKVGRELQARQKETSQ